MRSKHTKDALEGRTPRMHTVLKQHIDRWLDKKTAGSISDFLNAIDKSYVGFDRERSRLTLSLNVLEAAFESADDAVIVVEQDGRVRAYNKNFVLLWTMTIDLLRDKDFSVIYTKMSELGRNLPPLQERLHNVERTTDRSQREEYALIDGRIIESIVFKDPLVGTIWRFKDMTQRRQYEEQTRHQAQHDPLTGLPNRRLFQDRLTQALKKNRRSSEKIALLYLDLDGFKTINDKMGHAVGDQLLREVANRMHAALRAHDTLARLGGDEFIVLLEDISSHREVVHLAARLIESFREAFVLEGKAVAMTASIGISICPNDGKDPEELIRNADIAMYTAKDEGSNTYHFYTPALERLAKHRLSIETKLRRAFEARAFELHYQPIFKTHAAQTTTQDTLYGFEALLHWKEDSGRCIHSEAFMEVIEATDMALPLGQWIFEEACQQAYAWKLNRDDSPKMCINLSAKHLHKVGAIDDLACIIQNSGLDGRHLLLEISELALVHDLDWAVKTLSRLSDMGIGIVIDQFGSGYASMRCLQQLPVRLLKIDGAYIKNIEHNSTDRAIVTSMITLSHTLGLQIAAEHIETETVSKILHQAGCDLLQGSFLAAPLPIAEIRTRYLK